MLFLYDSFILLSAFLVSFAATGAVYAGLRRFQVLDRPNDRSNHSVPTPRGGGLGFVFALLGFLLVIHAPWQLLVGFALLTAVSFADDLRGLPPRLRFAAQLVAVALLLSSMPPLGLLPQWLELPVIALAWLWFINLFNFMDGSDGLAASEAIAIGAGVLLIALPLDEAYPLLHFGQLVTATVLGFAPWNWHRAKLFMGDVGSIPLGFLLGYLLLLLAGQGFAAAALILPAYFVTDASITLAGRLWRRERVFEAHSQHAYQQAIRGGIPHDAVARDVIALNLLLVILALLSTFSGPHPLPSVVVAYLAALALCLRFRRQGKGASV